MVCLMSLFSLFLNDAQQAITYLVGFENLDEILQRDLEFLQWLVLAGWVDCLQKTDGEVRIRCKA